jgi:drug/metabolite transporter (DMT)-like permease
LGICIIFLPEIEVSDPSITLKGSLLVLLSAVTYASYIFGSGWLIPKFGARRFTSYVMIVSSVLIIFQFMVESKMSINVLFFPKGVYIYGVLIALFSTVIPSFLISYAIKELGANQFSIFASIGPISTVLLAYLFLEERLSSLQIIGSVVVIMGVFAAEYFKRNPKT